MKLSHVFLSVLAVICTIVHGAGAAIAISPGIGVKFNSSGTYDFGRVAGNSFLEPTDVAGVIGRNHWNNTNGYFGGPTALMDSAGMPTTVSVSWTSAYDYRWVAFHTGTDPDSKLTNGEFEAETGTKAVVTITGVPYSLYDVYVYFGSQNNGKKGNGTLTPGGGTPTTIYYRSNDGYTSPYFQGYQEAIGTNDLNSNPSNYMVFHNVTSSSFVYSQQKSAGEIYGTGIHGIQIISVVPEPSALMPVGVAMAGVLLRNRRG